MELQTVIVSEIGYELTFLHYVHSLLKYDEYRDEQTERVFIVHELKVLLYIFLVLIQLKHIPVLVLFNVMMSINFFF